MPDAATPENPNRIPSRTTPTWEMELLISGATVFGLLQVPAQLDAWMVPWINASTGDISSLLLYASIYAKASALILIATFILHLCLRGYWVALVGMNSLYPGGIRWDRVRLGPHARDIISRRSLAISEQIEAADNRATRVFGVGFGLATLMLMLVAVAIVALAASLLGTLAGLRDYWLANVFWIVFALLVLPMTVAKAVDRRLGTRIAAGSVAGRVLRRLISFYSRFGIGNTRNALVELFASNEDFLQTRWMMLCGLLLVLAVTLLQTLHSAGRLPALDAYRGLPKDVAGAPHTVRPQHYASLRDTAPTMDLVPFLPDTVVEGSYLRLFLPYRPRLHDAAMRRACPSAFAAGGDTALECLARIEPITLDGIKLAPSFDASADPLSGQRGMLAMIPVAGLAPGRHELAIWLPPKAGAAFTAKPDYRIPFWK